MSLEIRPVAGGRDLRAFVELPFRLYANEPRWVPPLRLERRLFLDRRLNAFFKHGEAELLLALRDGVPVGRVSAHVDHAFDAYHGTRWGMFGFLELEDDPAVLDALLAAAERWLRDRGRDRMVGPMDFTLNDDAGVLVEGHDRPPVIRMPWQHPYLARLCEGAGLDKAMDLLMWEVTLGDRSQMLPVIEQLGRETETKYGIRVRKMTRRGLRRDLDRFAEVYNAAWARNWGFTPYSKEDLDAYAQEMQLVFEREWFMVAEKPDGETVAIGISVPDVNQVLMRMRGRVLPFGWWHFLRKRRIIDRVRVGFLGVKPDYQHTGVAARLYLEHFDTAARHPRVDTGITGWILETNIGMNRGMEAMHGRLYQRYRMYERRFGPDVEPAFPAGRRVWEPSDPAATIVR